MGRGLKELASTVPYTNENRPNFSRRSSQKDGLRIQARVVLSRTYFSLLKEVLLVNFFHQEFTVYKLGLGPHPHLRRSVRFEKEVHQSISVQIHLMIRDTHTRLIRASNQPCVCLWTV